MEAFWFHLKKWPCSRNPGIEQQSMCEGLPWTQKTADEYKLQVLRILACEGGP